MAAPIEGARSSSQLETAVLHRLTHPWSLIGQIRTRIPPGASASAISPAFHAKGLRVFYLTVLACVHLPCARLNLTTDVGDVAGLAVQPRASVGMTPTLPVPSPSGLRPAACLLARLPVSTLPSAARSDNLATPNPHSKVFEIKHISAT